MEGIFAQDFKDVETCVGDLVQDWNDLKSIIENMKEDETSIVALISGMGTFLQDVAKTIEDCKTVPDDIKAMKQVIAEIAADFSNPVDLVILIGKSVLFHGVEIYQDLRRVISFWKAGDYKNAGYNCGKIVNRIFVKVMDAHKQYTHRVVEIMLSTITDSKVDLQNCLSNTRLIYNQAKRIVDSMHDPYGTIEEYGAFVDTVVEATDSCEKDDQGLWFRLQVWTELLANYESVMAISAGIEGNQSRHEQFKEFAKKAKHSWDEFNPLELGYVFAEFGTEFLPNF